MEIREDTDPNSITHQQLWIARVTNRAEVLLNGTVLEGTVTIKNFDVLKARTTDYLGIHLGYEINPYFVCFFKTVINHIKGNVINIDSMFSDPLILDMNGDGISQTEELRSVSAAHITNTAELFCAKYNFNIHVPYTQSKFKIYNHPSNNSNWSIVA
jgi:hypothetical protein